jgi:hypothetical protein
VRFQPEKPLKGLVKQLKKKFREVGMGKYRPVLVGPDGAEIDEDGLPDDDDDAGEDDAGAGEDSATAAPEAAPETAPVDLGMLRERLLRVRAAVDGAPKDRAGPLVQAFARAVTMAKEGRLPDAAAALDVIEKALGRPASEVPPPLAPASQPPASPPPAPPPPDAAARLTATLAALVPRLRALGPGPVQTALAGQVRAAQGLIAAGELPGALAALRALTEALTRAEAPPQGANPQDIWNAAKEAADVGIARLQTALRGIGHPDTTRIAEFGLAGLSGGSMQTKLAAALLTHTRATGEGRAKVAEALRAVIAEYRAFLASNPLVALCDDNPFGVAVNLRGGLGQALDRIEGTLAA